MMTVTEDVAGRRICLVLGTSEGGIGAHVRVLCERLVAAQADVVVCAPPATQELFDFTATGARFVPVPIGHGFHPIADRRAVSALRAVAQEAELVHAHGLRAGLVAVRATQDLPVVVTWHNAVLATGARRRVFAAIERRIASRATLNLCVSSDLVSRVRRLGGTAELAPVGANPLPAGVARPATIRAQLDLGDRPLILSVGRLHAQKGFDVLVDAAAQLAGRTPTPVFAIAGEGPERAELQRAIARTTADVRLLGRRADVADLLAAAEVVVMPSRWEGSPLAAHEALLAGRPLIATAVGGLPDLAAGGAIDLVPAEDSRALAAALRAVLDDPEYAAGLAARGAARGKTWPDSLASADAVIARYGELLCE